MKSKYLLTIFVNEILLSRSNINCLQIFSMTKETTKIRCFKSKNFDLLLLELR